MNISTITTFNTVSASQNNQNKRQINRNYNPTMQPVSMQNNSPNFGKFLIDDLFHWGRKKLNVNREKKRIEQIKNVREQVHDDITLLSKRIGITREEAAARYQDDLDVAGIEPKLNGYNTGLNRVVGYSLEKLELMKKVVAPILRSVNKQESQYPVPNGVILYGPNGTGKSHLAESLINHFQQKSPERKLSPEEALYQRCKTEPIIKTKTIDRPWYEGDTEENFEALFETFEQAKMDAKKGDHTVIFINKLDELLNTPNADLLKTEFEFSTQHPAKNGVTWVGTTNNLNNLPDWMFDNNRTSIIMPIQGLTSDAENSAVLSHFISEVNRKDNSNHDVILDKLKESRIPRYPQYIREIVNNVDRNLEKTKDYYHSQAGIYREPVKDKHLKAAIDKWKEENSLKRIKISSFDDDLFVNRGGFHNEN